MLRIETELSRFSEDDVSRMVDALPVSWRTRITRKKPLLSRLQSAVAYTMLAEMLQQEYHLDTLPDIVTDENGKPHLTDSDLFFSISHCRCAVVCAVDTAPVAVDAQDLITSNTARLQERLGVQGLDERALTALWAQKEASAKLDGRGLHLPLALLPLAEHNVTTSDCGDWFLCAATYK